MAEIFLFIDDKRDPDDMVFGLFTGKRNYSEHVQKMYGVLDVVQVKSFDEFVTFIKTNSFPKVISFDHDLGDYEAFTQNVQFE